MSLRSRATGLLGLTLAVAGVPLLVAPAAQANTAGTALVISEAYGGGGNAGATWKNDFIELYNPTDAAIPVAGMSVQYRGAGATGVVVTSGITNLTQGSVPAKGYYLIQEAAGSGGTDDLPTPDAIGTIAMSGTGFTVFLSNGASRIDPGTGSVTGNTKVLDLVGSASNTYEGTTAAAVANATSVRRAATGADTDVNSVDLTVGTPSPTNAAGRTTGPLAVASVGTRSAVVGQPSPAFTVRASGATPPYAFSATGLPAGITLNPSTGVVTGTPTTVGTNAVTVTVTDSATPTESATTTFTYNVVAAPTATTIAAIQGDSTNTSPVAGSYVTTTGVVTSSYATGGLAGFTIQTGGADTTPDASDGIFVFLGDSAPGIAYPAIGATVTVTGTATEYFGLTEIGTVVSLATAATAQPAVVAKTVIPGTDCAEGSCPTAAALDALREKSESEVFQPTAPYTVTDAYDGSPAPSTSSSFVGEIGLAADSTVPLVAPTELYDSQTQAAQIAARTAYNDARRIIIDDGSSTNYTTTTGSPLPWFTKTHTVRAGAAVTFPQPMILSYTFSDWKLEPRKQVVGKPVSSVPTGSTVIPTGPTFAQDRPVAPSAVGGDLKLATFNVLNYFTTLGADVPGCSSFNDRAGNPLTVNTCPGTGPRGAWNAASLKRQQDKIVNAINTMDADIMSLEEIENSRTIDGPSASRDEALSTLVKALNADAGFTRWAFVPSPIATPAFGDTDAIRTAFIYDPTRVARVGASQLLSDPAFQKARAPLAQAFKAKGAADSTAVAVVVNHFKSKGSTDATGDNLDTGQGAYNGDRVRQATAVATFADGFAAGKGIDRIFLTGDFNAYTQEDPIQVLVAAGFTNLESTTKPGEKTYNFGGLAGSLDHVFFKSRSAAASPVTGVDIWNINADESVYYEYSRFNANVTDLYDASPFRASDHNPEIVGFTAAGATETEKIQLLATNDFHGRIAKDPGSAAAGAGVLAGAVKQLRQNNPDTVFAAAGDLVGASTFESFIDQDKPTIDALNSAGLDVSSVGNHEFDQGYDDLVNRIMAPESQDNPKGGAAWAYIGANVRNKVDNTHALAPRWTETFGDVKVGFVGAVTEHLPELVSPDGIADITVTDIVTEANQQAEILKQNGADIVVLLVHEGASSTAYADAVDSASDFGKIVTGVNGDFDAIVSGHTHLAYNHAVPVEAWKLEGRPVTTRPVVSAGQYGSNLNQLVFTYDDNSGEVVGVRQKILNLKTADPDGTFTENYPTDPATQAIVNTAVANADVLGAQPLGKVTGAFNRAKLADGTTENRGGESTLGNVVAEIQRWATRNPESGSAQIALMNPGGLRADLTGGITGEAAYPKTVTYKQAATVQPFANTLVNMSLTGAQLKTVLEQQWQPAGSSRPFLKLGISKGFTYTYVPSPTKGVVTAMYLDGVPIDPAKTYSVTVNSFLASGGDNFFELAKGARKQDTGKTDLQAQVDYFAAFASTPAGLAVDASQRGVGVAFPAGAPATYGPGSTVAFSLSSLSMTGPGDPADTSVTVKLGDTVLGTAPVTTTRQVGLPGYDEVGTASVSVTLPASVPAGAALTVVGATTGTSVLVPLTTSATPTTPTTPPTTTPGAVATVTSVVVKPKKVVVDRTEARVRIVVRTASGAPVDGRAVVRIKGQKAVTVKVVGGKATIRLDAFGRVGRKTVTVLFLGGTSYLSSADTATVKVKRK